MELSQAQIDQSRYEELGGQYEKGRKAAGQDGRKSGQREVHDMIAAMKIDARDIGCEESHLNGSALIRMAQLMAVMAEENNWVLDRIRRETARLHDKGRARAERRAS